MDELDRIEALPKEMLTPKDVCRYLKCSPYAINIALREGKTFPFPAFLVGTRVKIPKAAFVKAMRGE